MSALVPSFTRAKSCNVRLRGLSAKQPTSTDQVRGGLGLDCIPKSAAVMLYKYGYGYPTLYFRTDPQVALDTASGLATWQ